MAVGSRANWSDELGSSACVDHALSAGEGMGPLFDVWRKDKHVRRTKGDPQVTSMGEK